MKKMKQLICCRSNLPYLLIAAGVVLMAVRAFYGFDLSDETFYLALAKRFAGGDRLFCEEWFTTQLIGVLLLPLYLLYCYINGSQEGIILFVRLCYVLFSAGIALYLYYILRKREYVGGRVAVCASLLYLFYVRANISTFSYYSIGLGTFLIFLLLRESNISRGARFCAGISFSVSVLCMPYMILYFVIDLIKNLSAYIKKKKRWQDDGCFYAGIVFCAVVFLLYCFCSNALKDIPGNLIYILKDPEHQGSAAEALSGFFAFMAGTYYRFLFWPMLAEFLAIGWWRLAQFDGIHIHRVLKCTAYLLFFLQSVYLRTFFEGGVIIAFLLLAVQLSLLNRQFEKTLAEKYLFSGILFGLIWVIGSNVGQRVFNMGCIVADIWAFQIVWNDIQHSSGLEKQLKKLAPVLVVFILLVIRMEDVYRDAPPLYLTEVLTEGAGKGIRTTAYREENYMDVLKQLDLYAGEGRQLAVSGSHPWIYLEADASCGAFSVWNVDFGDERNSVYYEKYPEQIPDVIFILNPEYEKYEAWRFSSHGSNLGDGEKDSLKGWFLELAETENYQRYEETCGTFYIKENR